MIFAWMDRHLKWIFTLPAVIFIVVMVAFPIAYTVRISLYEWSMSVTTPPRWVGLDNYTHLLADGRFWSSVGRTFYHTGASIVIETVLGVLIAVLLSRKFKGQKWAKTLLMMPMVATPVSIALVWLLIYEPSIGVANQFLKLAGLKPLAWLGSVDLVLPSLILIDVWEWTPMIILIVVAGLTTLPADPYESASVDGASPMQKFFHITLPLLTPTIITAVILRLVDLLKTFDTIYATTQGGPDYASETLNLMIFTEAFHYFKFGSASALMILFFLIIMTVILAFIALKKRLGGLH
ncbi:carbohydrate ABC transporter permease [Paenibacillus piri]|uniref:Sugar ABC transporter permease n=1 Tax=Paenibacillus piri TaxID=2547395 RepID=A0A4R5KY86_9BACL|nr:sugar ABC transporter permease [Paenibacillus piri]TDG00186.1 sugar ABC transporter permease [Paenibacillus piri]